MQNQREAVSRRLSDPDFQASLVSRCIGLTIAMAAVLTVISIDDVTLRLHPPPPRYFFVDGRHPPHPAVALDSPIVDDTELLEWTVKAVLAPYNVNYHDYPEQLNTASRRFTVHGWNSFAASYIGNGNFDKMKQALLLCYAQAQRAAVIRRSMVVKGALAYEIQLPIVQTCQNSNQQTTQHLMITALVVRIESPDHPDGLAVDQLVAKVE